MIICADCLAEQYPGMLFCSECGSYLRQTPAAPAATLPATTPSATTLPVAPVPTPPVAQSPHAIKIRLFFPDQGELRVALTHRLLIGRADSETGTRPDIDLTPYSAAEFGVSRLHAVIQQSSGGVMLVDKSSTNGTYINNYQLVPEKPYLLGHGDQITLGSLDIIVYFE